MREWKMTKKSHIKLFFISTLTVLCCSPALAALIVSPARPITHTITVQPIIVSDDNGRNTANFFGSASQQNTIEGLINNIWSQAGIDVNFLMQNSWNNTFANWGLGGSTTASKRPTMDIDDINNNASEAGKTHADPNIINMFFVKIPAGFSLQNDDTVAGVAKIPGNVITQYVGTNLLGFSRGLDAIAGVVAHEIGHNLGLPHLVDMENLMQISTSPSQGDRLNTDQIAIALKSNLSVAVTSVPLPTAVWLFGSGLVGLISLAKSKKTQQKT